MERSAFAAFFKIYQDEIKLHFRSVCNSSAKSTLNLEKTNPLAEIWIHVTQWHT